MYLRTGAQWLLVIVGLLALAGCAGTSPVVEPVTVAPPTAPVAGYPAPSTLPTAPAAAGYPAPSTPVAAQPDTNGYPVLSSVVVVTAGPVSAGVAGLVTLAKTHLAQSLSVAADQITVISTESKDWPDASLGCPKVGLSYAQVITPGYQIILAYAQKQYDYHADFNGQLILCSR